MTTLEREQVTPAVEPSAAPDLARGQADSPIRSVFDLLASMKLTVVLLVILALLTWLGTLAQASEGIYYVQKEYFESWFVLPKLGLFTIPLPGAVPVLALLFVNLVVGGLARMRWSFRNVGILITHLGIAGLLVAGLVKLEMSYAGHLSLYEGETSNSMRSVHEWELALLRQDGDEIVERTLPGSVVESAAGGGRVRVPGEGLPFSIEVHHFSEHCAPVRKGPMFHATAPLVNNVFLSSSSRFVGAPQKREQKLAGCYVTVLPEDGSEEIQGILWAADMLVATSPEHEPFTFEVDGQTWGLELRHVVWNLPFDVRLDKFKKTDHPGTTMPRDFSSWVTVLEEGRSPREAHIYMNEPLRKDGYVFYQTSWGPQPMGGPPWYSVFEVANNPSDQWPKYACFTILIGLLIHFCWKLLRFISRENQRRAREAKA